MALPLTRNTTYAPLSQVLSADLNAIQDMIVEGKHGVIRKIVPANFGQGTGASANGGRMILAANETVDVALGPLTVGDQITNVFIVLDAPDADDFVTFRLHDQGGTSVGALGSSTLGAGTKTDNVDITSPPLIIATGDMYALIVTADGSNSGSMQIFTVEYLVESTP